MGIPLLLAAAYAAFLLVAWVSYIAPLWSSGICVAAMLTWILFLIYDYHRKTDSPSLFKAAGLTLHILPALFLYTTCKLADTADNSADMYFVSLLIFRYWRTLVQCFFWCMYTPTRPTGADVMQPKDCTVVLPTVGPTGNAAFENLVASVLVNRPARIVFSTNTAAAASDVADFLDLFRPKFEAGQTDYQQRYGLAGMDMSSDIKITNVGQSSKRRQVVAAIAHVATDILVSSDDTAEWTPRWLIETLAAFNDPKVGLVGSRKWVKMLPAPELDPAHGALYNAWLRWYARFWNNMGGLYLIRHNFEIQSTNAADGGIFSVSGRSCLIRTAILDPVFQHAFTNEYILGHGPVQADDDNFITRWTLNAGWKVKAQCQPAATMTTVLGAYPHGFKFFPAQCQRWSRTTFRQNALALLADRNIWWSWPLTVWTTYIPWLYNAALLWDSLALYTFSRTTLSVSSSHPWLLLLGLLYCLQLTKLIKTAAWWCTHPVDFLLYFVFPAYPAFTYCHSVLKLYTAITCLEMEWSGRALPPPEEDGEETPLLAAENV